VTPGRIRRVVAAGRLDVVRCALDALDVTGVGAEFSVDVNVFWTTDATRELAALHRALRPGYGERVLTTVAAAVAGYGFGAVRRLRSPHGFDIAAERKAQWTSTNATVR
jgi:hypothetical protein